MKFTQKVESMNLCDEEFELNKLGKLKVSYLEGADVIDPRQRGRLL